MNFLNILRKPANPAEDERVLLHLKHKLAEVASGRYLLKPSDRANTLYELEQRLTREIANLEARKGKRGTTGSV